MNRSRTQRSADVLCILAVALASVGALAGCGGASTGELVRSDGASSVKWMFASRPIPGVRQRVVGHGVRGAVLLWSAGRRPPRKTIVFFHGWDPVPPFGYGAWLRHLIAQGNTVIYPVYNERKTYPGDFRANALAGIAAGLRAANADPRILIAIGHTTGGALAFDYAAVAKSRGLPTPRAVLAVYPGRNPPGGEITPPDLSRIPARTRLEAIAGPGDPIPAGDAQARELLRGAKRVPSRLRFFHRAPDRNRYGPLEQNRAARRSFWASADRLIARARGVERRDWR